MSNYENYEKASARIYKLIEKAKEEYKDEQYIKGLEDALSILHKSFA